MGILYEQATEEEKTNRIGKEERKIGQEKNT